MFALPINMQRCKRIIFFIKIALKISFFCKKNEKLSSAGGSAPRPPCLRRLGAFPQPPATGGFASRPPLASSGWGLRPQTPKQLFSLRISGYAPGLTHEREAQSVYTEGLFRQPESQSHGAVHNWLRFPPYWVALIFRSPAVLNLANYSCVNCHVTFKCCINHAPIKNELQWQSDLTPISIA